MDLDDDVVLLQSLHADLLTELQRHEVRTHVDEDGLLLLFLLVAVDVGVVVHGGPALLVECRELHHAVAVALFRLVLQGCQIGGLALDVLAVAGHLGQTGEDALVDDDLLQGGGDGLSDAADGERDEVAHQGDGLGQEAVVAVPVFLVEPARELILVEREDILVGGHLGVVFQSVGKRVLRESLCAGLDGGEVQVLHLPVLVLHAVAGVVAHGERSLVHLLFGHRGILVDRRRLARVGET